MAENIKQQLGQALISGAESVLKTSMHDVPTFITVSKVKGKSFVSFLFDCMTDGKVELENGISIEMSDTLDISIDRKNNLEVVISPPIKVSYNLIGSINAKATLNGITLTKDKAKLRLKGIPDFELDLE